MLRVKEETSYPYENHLHPVFSRIAKPISQAQEQLPSSSKAFKLYNEIGIYSGESRQLTGDTSGDYLYNEYSSLQFVQPRLAFRWQAKGANFHEVEISQIRFNNFKDETRKNNDRTKTSEPYSGMMRNEFYLALRYEFTYTIYKDKDTRLKPSIGLAVSPSIGRERREPFSPLSFITSNTSLGASLFLIPRATYDLTKQWFLDFNIPVNLASIQTNFIRVENPAFTPEQQKNRTTNFEAFPSAITMRIGVGYKL